MLSRNTLFCSIAGLLIGTSLGQSCGSCQSFGLDYQSGGKYFIDSHSHANFNVSQEFMGCQNDTAHNILVNPKGGEYECSLTPLTPDNTPRTVICPIKDSQMWSGNWSILIISNNGECAPIDFQRQFTLEVTSSSKPSMLMASEAQSEQPRRKPDPPAEIPATILPPGNAKNDELKAQAAAAAPPPPTRVRGFRA